MARGMPIAEQSIATNGVTSVTPWTEARDRFAEMNRYWLATVCPDGRPHLMPVFGIRVGDALYFTAARTSRKAKNLALNARCVVVADVPTLDVVVEGEAARVSDEAKLHLVADAYASKHEWPLTVRDGAFFAEYEAPSAGSAPLRPARDDAGDGLRSRHGRAIRGHALEILDGVLPGGAP